VEMSSIPAVSPQLARGGVCFTNAVTHIITSTSDLVSMVPLLERNYKMNSCLMPCRVVESLSGGQREDAGLWGKGGNEVGVVTYRVVVQNKI
jgi:hypothetical protein